MCIAVWLQVESALAKAGIRTDARAQDLTVKQFAEVFNNLQESSPGIVPNSS